MKKIYIKTTETCQLKCDHCYIGENRKLTGFFDDIKTIEWLEKYIHTFSINESDILFSFHGGEPFLCSLSKMQNVIDAFPKATYDATSNLCFNLSNDKLQFIKQNFVDKYGNGKPFIKTSWDYGIRFHKTNEILIWEKNVKTLLSKGVEIRVIICLTSFLISEVNPAILLEYLLELGITDIHFERLTENTTVNKNLIPDYNNQDEWLLKFYELSVGKITVDMFEELKHASKGIFINCRNRCCMKEVITINANGTIGGCPNSAISKYYTNINESPIGICKNYKLSELINAERTRHMECFICDLYQICNGDCHQLSWRNNVCCSPKKLIRRIKHDMETAEKISISDAGV